MIFMFASPKKEALFSVQSGGGNRNFGTDTRPLPPRSINAEILAALPSSREALPIALAIVSKLFVCR